MLLINQVCLLNQFIINVFDCVYTFFFVFNLQENNSETFSHISQLVKVCVRLSVMLQFFSLQKWRTKNEERRTKNEKRKTKTKNLPRPNHVFIQVGQIRSDFDTKMKMKKKLKTFSVLHFAGGHNTNFWFASTSSPTSTTFCTLTSSILSLFLSFLPFFQLSNLLQSMNRCTESSNAFWQQPLKPS